MKSKLVWDLLGVLTHKNNQVSSANLILNFLQCNVCTSIEIVLFCIFQDSCQGLQKCFDDLWWHRETLVQDRERRNQNTVPVVEVHFFHIVVIGCWLVHLLEWTHAIIIRHQNASS